MGLRIKNMVPNENPSFELGRFSLFSDLAGHPAALDTLATLMQRKSFQTGDDIITDGTAGSDMFFLLGGKVGVFKTTNEGENYPVTFLNAETYPSFGEAALIDVETRSATIRAVTNCDCLVLSRKAFDGFCETHPDWANPVLRQIARAIASRLRKSNSDFVLLYRALLREVRGN